MLKLKRMANFPNIDGQGSLVEIMKLMRSDLIQMNSIQFHWDHKEHGREHYSTAHDIKPETILYAIQVKILYEVSMG